MMLSHCICPTFLSKHIGDDSIFYKVFLEKLILSQDQIVFDDEERLANAYIELIQNDDEALRNYSTWTRMLETQFSGKVLKSSSAGATSSIETVYKTISRAITTSTKTIITSENNHYDSFLKEINRQRIYLLNLHNLASHNTSYPKKRKTYEELESDIEWVLQRLARRAEKSHSEDSNNDYVRDMLLSKEYEVKDQTREGLSTSGKGSGELDLIFEENGDLFSIYEALKLSSLDIIYLDSHYKKLILNYNPLSVKRTFLVTYYTGSNFSNWWSKYISYISSLDMRKFINDDYEDVSKVEDSETKFPTVKKLHHHFINLGEPSQCTHFAIRIGH